jgi:hypothetical protein
MEVIFGAPFPLALYNYWEQLLTTINDLPGTHYYLGYRDGLFGGELNYSSDEYLMGYEDAEGDRTEYIREFGDWR